MGQTLHNMGVKLAEDTLHGHENETQRKIRLENEDQARKQYGLSTSDVIYGTKPTEFYANGLKKPPVVPQSLVDHVHHMQDAQKKMNSVGAVNSVEEMKANLLKRGFSEEDAERIAHESCE